MLQVVNVQPEWRIAVFKLSPLRLGGVVSAEEVEGMSLGHFHPLPTYSKTTQEQRKFKDH